jgi:hypothetical protein
LLEVRARVYFFGPWEGMKGRDFYRGRPNRTVFYGPNHFFYRSKFFDGKAVFWARIGPTERGLSEFPSDSC